jgi:ParB family chromosome partitioning protein
MTTQTLKLNQIKTSKDNPRKNFDDKSIEGLAQSIKTDGLLQNLIVQSPQTKKGKHTIICGERRFRALNHLLEHGDIEKGFPVNVEIKDDLTAEEILRMATVENVQRENLSPLEEANAIASLIKDGEKLDEIVSQTGLTTSSIRRRLMLLELNDEVTQAFIDGELTLSQAESFAFGSSDEQSRVLRQALNGWCDSPEDIKESLIGEKPNVALAIFDTALYEGDYTSDLLAEDKTTFFNDREQFDELQKQAAEKLVDEYSQSHDWAELEEGYYSSWQYSEAEEGETGGVIVNILSSGEVEIHKGLIRPEIDESNVVALKPKPKATYGKPLVKYMNMHKCVAVQNAILNNPRKAKEIMVAKKLATFKDHPALRYFEDEDTYSRSLDAINAKARILLSYFDKGDEESTWRDLQSLFQYDVQDAYYATQALSDVQLEDIALTLEALEFGTIYLDTLDTHEDSVSNHVANALKVDMRGAWRPDEPFLKRRNKEQLHGIIQNAGCSLKYGTAQGYKKGELVTSMAKHFAHVLTLESPSADELKTQFWIPEAMQFPAIDPDSVQVDEPESIENEDQDQIAA